MDALAVSTDKARVALNGDDEEILVRPFGDGSADAVVLSGHDDAVTSLVFLGDALVSASRDGTIRVWDVAARRAVGGVQAHTSWVNCCALSVDGRSLVSVGTDGMIRVWDVPLLEQGQVRGHVDWVNDLTVTGDGTQIASGGNDHTVRLWSADDGKARRGLASAVEGLGVELRHDRGRARGCGREHTPPAPAQR